MRTQSVIAFHQGNQIAFLVSQMFQSKREGLEVHEAYPGFFPDLEQKAAKEKMQQQHWQIMKARIEAYAANEAEKRKRGERRGDDAGRTANFNND